MMKAGVEQIDPDQAEAMLGTMIENRRIRWGKVGEFARDMRAGRWRLTGEAIKLTEDGKVIDGEHRLRAIITSGQTVETFVVHGAQVDDRIAMDSGSSRTLTDHLRFLREERPAELASALVALDIRHGPNPAIQSAGSNSTTKQEYVDLLDQHPQIRESVQASYRTVRLLRLPRGIAAALHYDMVALDPDDADDFWSRLHSGANMAEHSPILVLRRRLEENAATVGRKYDRVTLHAFIIKGWNAYRDGREITFIRWNRGGSNPEEFPVLH